MNNNVEKNIGESVERLLSLGRLWAGHGLRAGKQALETSAETLKVTAATLDDLSERIAKTDDDNSAES